jgi:hypothetical protein
MTFDPTPPAADARGPFAPGDAVALRSVRMHGRHGVTVGFATGARVVHDDGDLMVLCTPLGTDVRSRAGTGSGPNGRSIVDEDWDGSYRQRAWDGATVVRVHRRGDPWSVWRWHDGTEWGPDWYGNLERPWRRTALGFDSQDWALDVVATTPVEPGAGLGVRLKDEDELAWFVEQGVVAEREAAVVRATGDRLAARARSGAWPFDADWSAWVPDPAWPAVALPPAWSRVEP